MVNGESNGRMEDRWQIVDASGAWAVRAEATANDDLRWMSMPDGHGGWEITGERPGFLLDLKALGRPLAAGWYELCGWLEVQNGSIELPSLRLHYVRHSALTGVEFVLSRHDASGRVRALILFIEDVQSLEFSPGICAARFRMRDFSLRRVSRLGALRAMLCGPDATPWTCRARRLFEWARVAKRRGLKRATDALYADYRNGMRPHGASEYEVWVRKYDTVGPVAIEGFRQRARALGERGPFISVLLIVGNPQEPWLRHCLDSVLGQVWEQWELCVVDCASGFTSMLNEYVARDPRVRIGYRDDSTQARNTVFGMAHGEFLAWLDEDGGLRPHALLCVAEAVAANPELAIVYADEDRIDADGRRSDPHFKPDWNPDLLRSRDYVGRLAAIRTSVVREAGGVCAGFEGNPDHDLLLRCSERVVPQQIHHIPAILYHGCATTEAITWSEGGSAAVATTGMRVVTEHLQRIGAAADIEASERLPDCFRVRWRVPQPAPRVSLIIPTRDRAGLLRMCVESILAKTTYPDFELVVVDNQSCDRAAMEYMHELATRERVRVLRYNAPFNYSTINNWAVPLCTGEVLGLVNNDIEVISPDWLEEMVGFAVRPDTGAVGAMLYYPDDTIQHAGMLLGINGVAGHVYAGKPRGYHGYMTRALLAQNLSAVTGACLLVRRKLFEEVGGLDEKLPVEFNDVDFCMRLSQRGYRNVWTPFAELYHHESASRSISSDSAEQARFDGVKLMQQRWSGLLRADPAYNSNLSLQSLDSELAFPPRTWLGEVSTHQL